MPQISSSDKILHKPNLLQNLSLFFCILFGYYKKFSKVWTLYEFFDNLRNCANIIIVISALILTVVASGWISPLRKS